MKHAPLIDYYELLQVSPRAESETIERVFRHLAKRYHPDAPGGDSERFQQLLEAFRVLSDPAQRASYDVRFDAAQRERWRLLAPEAGAEDADADRRLQAAVLTILLKARRRDPERAGVGIVELERLLDCPEAHMRYHIWYLKEHGWITRLENGTLAITVGGVDRVLEADTPAAGLHLLKAAPRQDAAPAAGAD
jgi:curved DNA-binding protein CbpA